MLSTPIFFAMIAARERQCTAGVLLFSQPEKVGGVADLGLDFLLAVAVIVVGNDGDDDAALVARGDLERCAIVIQLVLVLPAHAVSPLARGGVVPVGQAQCFLGEAGQVRRQNHAAGVAGPMIDIQSRIVLDARNGLPPLPKMLSTKSRLLTRLPGAKNRISMFFSGFEARNLRADDRAQQQRNEHPRFLWLTGGERQGQQVFGRGKCLAQKTGEDVFGYGLLVAGDGQATLGDMEGALGRAAVAGLGCAIRHCGCGSC